MATAAAASDSTTKKTSDRPEKTLDTVPDTTTEEVSTDNKNGDSGEAKSNAKDTVTVTADDGNKNSGEGESVTDTQKKVRRAERFGLPVQFSEEEKRNSRAERFGTAPGSQGSDAIKKDEELKRKARAERFGITKSTPGEEEEKKKARLSRFGSSSSADPIEEEKKKARALRFSATPLTGNGKIEPIVLDLFNRRQPLLARQGERLEALTLSFFIMVLPHVLGVVRISKASMPDLMVMIVAYPCCISCTKNYGQMMLD